MFPLIIKYSVKDFLALAIWFAIIIKEHGKTYVFPAILAL